MIKYIESGDLFKSNSRVLVNTVNCAGVMGKGIALQFKNRYPYCFPPYVKACKHGDLKPGGILYVEYKKQSSLFEYQAKQHGDLTAQPDIVHFATKKHWRAKSKLQWIEDGLQALRNDCQARPIESLAMPPLGCGLGGLQWNSVKLLIDKYLSDLNTNIEVYIGSTNDFGESSGKSA